jgi:D-sedoheptulose 7-phosphate isomerase
VTAAATSQQLDVRLRAREQALTAFLDENGERLSRAAHDVARCIDRGGVLHAHGTGSAAADAAQVVVELMHPGDGKRALPALAPSNDPTGAMRRSWSFRPDDIALSITNGPVDAATSAFLDAAARRGALTIALVGAGGPAPTADHVLTVDASDPHLVQEIHSVAHHVLSALVLVFLEHPALLEDACITCGDIALPGRVVALTDLGAQVDFDGVCEEVACELIADVTVGDLLLCHAGVALERLDQAPEDGVTSPERIDPLLQRAERDIDAVLRHVRESTAHQGRDALHLQHAIDVPEIDACAVAIRERMAAGGRVLTFANGGSATGAQDFAADLLDQGWTAVALGSDGAAVTALADDGGFDDVFSRPVLALGHSRDVVIALSPQQPPENILRGLAAARDRGMLTCAIVGREAGLTDRLEWLDHVLVVPSDDVPRVREAQTTMYHLILEAIGSPA